MEHPTNTNPFDPSVLDEAAQDALADDLMAQSQMNVRPARFGVYAAVKAELIARGIPAEQIAFIQDFGTPTKRAELFAWMRRGDIRVLLCSKQSTGMNVQDRMIALHHLDAPWRPGDLEQRNGRIERQGNAFPEVYQYVYVTSGSFDGFIWQTLETKSRFINQMRSGDVSVRELDDVGEAVLSAAEIKALASGNPKIMLKVKLDSELAKLESLRAEWQENKVRMRKQLLHIEADRHTLDERQVLLDAAFIVFGERDEEAPFQAAIPKSLLSDQAVVYTKRVAAGKALRALVEQTVALATKQRDVIKRTIGLYRGFVLRAHAFSLGHVEVVVAFVRDGKVTSVSSKPIKVDTDESVFASIDAILRGLPDRRAGVDAERVRLNDEEAKLTASLADEWREGERYARIKAERDALNAELAQTEPQTPAEEAVADATKTTFTVVDEADVAETNAGGSPERFTPEWMIPPEIHLPAPANPQAMAEAIARLRQPHEQPPVEMMDAAEARSTPETVDEAAETLTIAPCTIALPTPHTPAPVFGQSTGSARRAARKATASASAQLALWEDEASYAAEDDALKEQSVGQPTRW